MKKTEKKPVGSFLENMLEEVNSTPVTKKDLMKVAKAVHQLPEDRRGIEGTAITAIQQARGNSKKSLSITFRMMALSRLLDEGEPPGWSMPGDDGSVFIQEPVLAAAGVFPLIQRGEELVFDREPFLLKVLELDDTEKIG